MPTKRNPRRSSMQFWHRQRAARLTARVRTWASTKDAKLLGFPAYKAGMTHILYTDNKTTSLTKGEDIATAVTILESPPIKIIGIKTLKNIYDGKAIAQVKMADKPDKNLKRALVPPKQYKDVTLSTEGITEVRVLAQTQPSLIGLKKTPEIIEIAIGGHIPDQLKYAESILGKEIKASDVLVDGQQIDAHGVTKGYGTQGPVSRHGVMIRSHKAQKTKRGPGTLGPWDGNRSYRVAHAGQTGFARRTEINKWVLRVDAKPDDFNCKGGFMHYGILKSSCIIIKGSIMGPCKRLITLTQPVRPNTYLPKQAPAIVHISTVSKQ